MESQDETPRSHFAEGSTMRHVVVMSTTGAAGLMALFLVDLIDMFFLSLLGEEELAAAIGFAGTILFFTVSVAIGLSIAMGALVSGAIGRGDRTRAKRLVINNYVFGFTVALILAILLWPAIPALLTLIGAEGRTHDLATGYLRILIPSMPLLSLGISSGGVLRAVGDAKRAMYITLAGGAANLVFDPIFIFALEMGVDGAAVASLIARVTIAATGLYGVVRVHRLLGSFDFQAFRQDIAPISKIAGPAVLTNVATPIGNAYVTATIAQFGVGAVAGAAIVGRITPLAFALFFSLSGAVGPIIGQNFGAHRFDRVNRTLMDSLIFAGGYTLLLWALMVLGQDLIITIFAAGPEAAPMIHAFCVWVVPLTFFLGALFVSNAAFNNLGRAFYATITNFGRASVGTIPFVYLGAQIDGAVGALIGQALGAMVFGIISMAVCFWLVARLEHSTIGEGARSAYQYRARMPLWPFSSSRIFNCPSEEELEKGGEPGPIGDRERSEV